MSKLLVKDLKAFVRSHEVLFATGPNNENLFVLLWAAPNVPRYIVRKGEKEAQFKKQGDAIETFNRWSKDGGN